MSVNTSTYAEVPIHVAVEGGAETVTVQLGEGDAVSAVHAGGIDWVATIATGGAGAGDLVAVATGGGESVEVVATLAQRTEGVQVTDFDSEGLGDTPRLHRVGERLVLTWADEREGTGDGWLVDLDGAGAMLGDPIRITPDGADPTTAAAAVGEDAVAVVYQQSGGPYVNWLRVVSLADGDELVAPIALDGPGESGASGIDVVWDGTGFIAVWRSFGGGSSEVRWMRLDGSADWAPAGPVVVWDEDDGNLQPFTFLRVAAVDSRSVASWAYDSDALGFTVQKAAYRVLDAAGSSLATDCVGSCTETWWDWEVQLGVADGSIVALRASDDLTAPDPIPTDLWIATFDGAAPERGIVAQASVIAAPETRSEPAIVDTELGWATMAWLDYRSGSIRLYAAAVR